MTLIKRIINHNLLQHIYCDCYIYEILILFWRSSADYDAATAINSTNVSTVAPSVTATLPVATTMIVTQSTAGNVTTSVNKSTTAPTVPTGRNSLVLVGGLLSLLVLLILLVVVILVAKRRKQQHRCVVTYTPTRCHPSFTVWIRNKPMIEVCETKLNLSKVR